MENKLNIPSALVELWKNLNQDKIMYEHNKTDFICGALVGGTIATLASLLFTTKKGKQIQKQVCDWYEDAEETVTETCNDVKEKVIKK